MGWLRRPTWKTRRRACGADHDGERTSTQHGAAPHRGTPSIVLQQRVLAFSHGGHPAYRPRSLTASWSDGEGAGFRDSSRLQRGGDTHYQTRRARWIKALRKPLGWADPGVPPSDLPGLRGPTGQQDDYHGKMTAGGPACEISPDQSRRHEKRSHGPMPDSPHPRKSRKTRFIKGRDARETTVDGRRILSRCPGVPRPRE